MLLGTVLGLFIGFVLLSLFPALAQAGEDDPGLAPLVPPLVPIALGAVPLLSQRTREGGRGFLRGLATGLLTGGLAALLLIAALFGVGPL